jgi:hypothetical protein
LTIGAIGQQFWNALGSPFYTALFFAGIGLLWFASTTDLRKASLVKAMFRWLHDANQFVVATMMLHPVVAIRKERKTPEESRVRWLGRGNWVMLVAPYVIPLSTIVLWCVGLLLLAPLRSALLGFGLALHLVYVLFQWNEGTSELRRLGRRFCWMFLPAANLVIAGLVFAFAIEGFTGAGNFFVDWVSLPFDVWSAIAKWWSGGDSPS